MVHTPTTMSPQERQIVEFLRDIEMQCLMNYLLKVAILKYLLDVRTIISTSGTSLNVKFPY